jgi:hypothetical protein
MAFWNDPGAFVQGKKLKTERPRGATLCALLAEILFCRRYGSGGAGCLMAPED